MEEQRQKSWFARNWTRAVPLGGCLTLIILSVVVIGVTIFVVSKAISGSEPYTYAVAQAKSNTVVLEVLGEPVATDGIMQGNISLKNGDSGHVDIEIPLIGSKTKGFVAIVGEKHDGEWIYEKIYVLVSGTNETIDLLPENE